MAVKKKVDEAVEATSAKAPEQPKPATAPSVPSLASVELLDLMAEMRTETQAFLASRNPELLDRLNGAIERLRVGA